MSIQKSETSQKSQLQIVDNQKLGTTGLYKEGDKDNVLRMGNTYVKVRMKWGRKNNRSTNNRN